MLYHGAMFEEMTDSTYYLVEDYFARKSLAKIGVTETFDKLDDFEVKYLTIIDQELMELEAKNAKNRSPH